MLDNEQDFKILQRQLKLREKLEQLKNGLENGHFKKGSGSNYAFESKPTLATEESLTVNNVLNILENLRKRNIDPMASGLNNENMLKKDFFDSDRSGIASQFFTSQDMARDGRVASKNMHKGVKDGGSDCFEHSEEQEANFTKARK